MEFCAGWSPRACGLARGGASPAGRDPRLGPVRRARRRGQQPSDGQGKVLSKVWSGGVAGPRALRSGLAVVRRDLCPGEGRRAAWAWVGHAGAASGAHSRGGSDLRWEPDRCSSQVLSDPSEMRNRTAGCLRESRDEQGDCKDPARSPGPLGRPAVFGVMPRTESTTAGLCFVLETGCHCVDLAHLESTEIHLPLPAECWNYRPCAVPLMSMLVFL